MPHRYFTTQVWPDEGRAVLQGPDAHHLARVMRAKAGDTVILCDGNAVEYTATITGFGEDEVEFSVEAGYPSAAEPSVEVTLLAGYPKQDKLEQIIRHGVELGCRHFVPFFQPLLRGRPQKRGTEERPLQPHRLRGRQAVRPGACCPMWPCPLPNFGAVCRTFGAYDLVLFCYECGGEPLRRLLADAPRPGGPAPAHRHCDRRGRGLRPRGSRGRHRRRRPDSGPRPPHPPLRDGPSGRPLSRHDPDGQSGVKRPATPWPDRKLFEIHFHKNYTNACVFHKTITKRLPCRRFFCCLPGALHYGKAENNKRINIRKITHKIKNILSRLRRELKKRKQKPKICKSGLDTGGGGML